MRAVFECSDIYSVGLVSGRANGFTDAVGLDILAVILAARPVTTLWGFFFC